MCSTFLLLTMLKDVISHMCINVHVHVHVCASIYIIMLFFVYSAHFFGLMDIYYFIMIFMAQICWEVCQKERKDFAQPRC